ncbi:MAG: FG-GAP-like repeat-containing protein [Planctomycetota bacterium]|nr:FG-GAP-like repeat-containing protein [Planctomycetota bacterium]
MSRRPRALGLFCLAGLTTFAAVASAQCGPFFANPAIIRGLPGGSAAQLHVIDLGGNSAPELISATRGGPSAGISIVDLAVLNQTQVTQFIPLGSADTYTQFRVADLNRDGILDLLSTQYSTGSVRVHLGNGNGWFSASPASFAAGNAPAGLACADLNNDGKIDAIATNVNDGTYSVLMGNGDGTFQPRVAAPTGFAQPTNAELVDMNGDGRLDLILAGLPFTFAVALGNGNGTFGTPAIYTSAIYTSGGALSIAIADVNADGSTDLIVGGTGTKNALLMLGRPNGTLAPETQISIGDDINTVRTIAVGDYNLEGKPDIGAIVGNGSNVGVPRIALGLGNGTFAAPLEWGGVNPSGGTVAATAADINRDGLPDLAYVDRFGQLISLNSTSGGPVQVNSPQGDLVIAPGTNASTGVFASGAGVQYQWFKRGTPLLNTARVYASGPDLVINDARDSDSGVYQCRVFNACSSVTTTSYVHVLPLSSVCPVDFNEDGFLTFEDFDAFVRAFEEGC